MKNKKDRLDKVEILLYCIMLLSGVYVYVSCFLEGDISNSIRVIPFIVLTVISSFIRIRQKQNNCINEIKNDFDLYKQLSIDEIENKKIQLNWEGQNNVLTDMFRQAKNRGYLTNSIPDIALFLKENFSCFEKTKLSTIETQLKNNTSSANAIPKEEKRIKLDE